MKFLNSWEKILLILIVTLFLSSRLYKISEIPTSVYWDEASIGYNAYSIVQTGKDEWGDFLPLHFRAFGEFKLPVYIYSVVPLIKIFGLNEFSVRLPAVLYSLGVVILTYLLAKKLSGSGMVGLLSSFLISISPWFFIFSRTGFEVTCGLMFHLLGIYFFLSSRLHLEGGIGGFRIFISILSFVISAYSYNSFRIIAPLTILILFFLERDNLKDIIRKQFKWVILSLTTIFISIWPVYRLYVYDVGFFRLQAVGTVNTETFIKNYASHFSLDFLFFGDKNLRHQQQGFGQIYPVEVSLILFGLLYILRNKSKYIFLPLLFTLISPIPAALTKESPHALRALSMAPFIHLISAMGVVQLLNYFPKKYFVIAITIFIFLVFFITYLINFLSVYSIQSKDHWQYSYKKFYTIYKEKFTSFDRIIVSDEYAQPYIFALFYLKYDPEKFQQDVARNPIDKWGFSTVSKFGKFEFGKIDDLLKDSDGVTLIFESENRIYER